MAHHTQVGIVGAGPAGLLLGQMLHLAGVDSIIVEARNRPEIEATIRAGVLEQSTVDLMHQIGASERLAREGFVHEGFDMRFGGASHRIDLADLTDGRVITVYPQHEVLKDLIELRLSTGRPLLFERKVTAIEDVTSEAPRILFEAPDGTADEIVCDIVVACDGGHSIGRRAIPEGTVRHDFTRVYPFGWFGILCEAEPSSHELIYANHPRGFSLISTRSPGVQRMYFQCDPHDSVDNWSEDRIWSELQARVAGADFRLKEGPIFQKGIIPLRSFVSEPMQHGRLFLAGDAAHSVPPTGAKGLNLAAADVFVLGRALERFFAHGATADLETYTDVALKRVWRAQHFSWWMTSMLHRFDAGNEFDARRQIAELTTVTGSRAGRTFVAENYVGLPLS
jgi:p-hydroxybenzoate 3-monooxygenase